MPHHVLSAPIPGVCVGGSLVDAPLCAQTPCPRVCVGGVSDRRPAVFSASLSPGCVSGSLIDAPPFSQHPHPWVCVGGSLGGQGQQAGERSMSPWLLVPHLLIPFGL